MDARDERTGRVGSRAVLVNDDPRAVRKQIVEHVLLFRIVRRCVHRVLKEKMRTATTTRDRSAPPPSLHFSIPD